MRVVVIGAGKLGYSIAELMSNEQYDVVFIDIDEQRLEQAKNTLDVLTICSAATSQTLFMDPDVKGADMVIAVTFFGLILGSMAFLLLDLLLRKKASHIAAVLVACAVSFAYCLAMGIYRFALGSVNVLTGILYGLAALGVAASAALFFKKALDGDNLTAYWACFAFAAIFLVFGGAGDKSFSILNAYSHNGDFNFWMGYLSSRLVVVLFLVAGYVNQRYDYCPEEKLASEAK